MILPAATLDFRNVIGPNDLNYDSQPNHFVGGCETLKKKMCQFFVQLLPQHNPWGKCIFGAECVM